MHALTAATNLEICSLLPPEVVGLGLLRQRARALFLLLAVSHTVQQLMQRSAFAPFFSSVLGPRNILATTPLRY